MHTRLQQYTQDNYNNTHKKTTTMHTRQLQQYTQENYNNAHKTTTTIHTRQLQQYTQENYNNAHKTTTIHTRKLQQCAQDNYNNTHQVILLTHFSSLFIFYRYLCNSVLMMVAVKVNQSQVPIGF